LPIIRERQMNCEQLHLAVVAKIGCRFSVPRQAKLIKNLEPRVGIEPTHTLLQSVALPFGHRGGARGGPRTHDLLLGKQMLYRLSYTRKGTRPKPPCRWGRQSPVWAFQPTPCRSRLGRGRALPQQSRP
jgi:hypothetical protein